MYNTMEMGFAVVVLLFSFGTHQLGIFADESGLKSDAAFNNGPLLLTDYIERNQVGLGRRLSKVRNLQINFGNSYSGFITTNNTNLFFWFFESKKKPETSPLVVWLNGGPGVSSMQGLLYENGPISLERQSDGSVKIVPREVNWAREFSVLYIDNPASTGYSFSTGQSYRTRTSEIADDLYNFLKQFYKIFPEYTSRELYIGGQSYGGKYVTALAYKIHQDLVQTGSTSFPLAGIYLGGALIDPLSQFLSTLDMLYNFGAISMVQREHYTQETLTLAEEYRLGYLEGSSGHDIFYKMLGALDVLSSLGLDNYYTGKFPYIEAIGEFMNLQSTRWALHVGKDLKFRPIDDDVFGRFGGDIFESWTDALGELMDQYKVLIYEGDMDVVVPHVGTETSLLNNIYWSRKDEYRNASPFLWKAATENRGFVTHVGQICRVTVMGAGHQTPHDRPEATFQMISDFIYKGCIQQNKGMFIDPASCFCCKTMMCYGDDSPIKSFRRCLVIH